MRGYAANRYAKAKDTAYTKIIADKGLNLHYRSAVMETYGAFGDSLWGIITELTDPNTHPRASGDYDPWCRPDPGPAPRLHPLSGLRAAAGQCGDAAAGERSAPAEPGWRTSRCGRARLGP